MARSRPVILAVLLLAAVPLVSLVAGPASPAGAAAELEVIAGHAGLFARGTAIPVRVTIRADRLVQGELRLLQRSGGLGTTTVSLPVEVPGASVKEYLTTVPAALGSDRAELQVELLDGGTVVAEGSDVVQVATDRELVGLLPGTLRDAGPPAPAPLAVDAGTAQFLAIGETELAMPAAVEGLGVIGATADDLAGLSTVGRRTLLDWVSLGGHLLVDTAPGEDVPLLPQAWQPGGDGRAAAGLGEVLATDGAMSAGRWAGLVEPRPRRGAAAGAGFGGEGLDTVLGRDAGVRVPDLGWLVGFIALYVLVVTPLTLTVLRRIGRGELGWVALPAVAVAFTAVGWFTGSDLRSGATASHATALRTTPEGAVATAHLGVVSRDGGTVRTGYPPSWQAGIPTLTMGEPASLQTGFRGEGVETRQRLATGEFSVQAGEGPVTLEGGLDVSATSADDDVASGTVRNALPFAVDEVGIFVDRAGTNLGRLEPGEERQWTVRAAGQIDPWQGGAVVQVWPSAVGFDRPADPESVVSFPLWTTVLSRSPSSMMAPGSVVAAGWTRDYSPPVDPPGGDVDGRTLVVSTATVRSEGDRISALAVRASQVRGPVIQIFPGGGVGTTDDGERAVLRFALPDADHGGPPVGAAGLLARGPRDGMPLEIWRDGAWQHLGGGPAVGGARAGGGGAPDTTFAPPPVVDAGGGPFGPLVDYAVPPAAVQGGVVWMRVGGGGFPNVDPFMLASVQPVSVRGAP